jgi:hypothetical protein
MGHDVKIDYSICCKLDLSSEATRKFIEVIMTIYNKCAVTIEADKRSLRMPYFSLKHPEMGFKEPIYHPTDHITGERIVGRAPSIYWKLKQRDEQTVFYGNNNEFIPWHALEYQELILIPTIHIRSVFIGGGRASFQISLISARILEMRSCNSVSKQLDPLLSKCIVRYQQYSRECFTFQQAEAHQYDKESWYRIPVMYNYGTDEQRKYDSFLLEGPEMDGILHDNKMTCELTGSNSCTETIHELIEVCKYVLNMLKGRIRISDVTGILHDPIDNNKLSLYLSKNPRKPTLFTDRNGKVVTPNKNFRCIPLIHVKHIDVRNGRAELKMELHSAIIE